MPKRSNVMNLPPSVRQWIDKALVEGNFSGYEALSEALKKKGYSISKSSLHRYGKEFEDTMAAATIATEQAKALVEACPDDAGAMNDAIIRLAQQKSFEVLMKIQADPDNISFTALGKMISSLTKSSVSVKKFMAEVNEKAQKAAEASVSIAKKGGLSEEAANQIRTQILGIAS